MAFLVTNKIYLLKSSLVTFFRAAFYIPTVVSGVILSVIWLWIFNPAYGLLNYLVSLFGFKHIVWLASKYTLYYLMIVVLSFGFGVPVIVYLAAMGNISPELYEAARIDGATRRDIKWKITFPLLKPTTFFLLVIRTIGVFQVWVVIQLLTDGGPAHSTETIVFQIYRYAFMYNQFGRASALGMVLVAIIVVIIQLQRKYIGGEIEY